MARIFFIEHKLTIYHNDFFEAESLEDARRMRDHLTMEYQDHLMDVLNRKPMSIELMDNIDYNDLGAMDPDYAGHVISRADFIKQYTSLED